MSLFTEYIILILCFLTCFFLMRLANAYYLSVSVSKNRRKSLAKGQSFFDWLLYKKHSEVLPLVFRIGYFLNFGLFLVLAICCPIFYLTQRSDLYNKMFTVYFYASIIFILVPYLAGEAMDKKRKKKNK